MENVYRPSMDGKGYVAVECPTQRGSELVEQTFNVSKSCIVLMLCQRVCSVSRH